MEKIPAEKIKIENISIEKIKNGEFQNELPEFYEMKNVFKNNSWHRETSFDHVLTVLEEYEKFIEKYQLDFFDNP